MVNSFIRQNVAGMFFAPLELSPDKDVANRRLHAIWSGQRFRWCFWTGVTCRIRSARRIDLVGVDNRRAGYVAAAHLLPLGVRRLAFLGRGQCCADGRCAHNRVSRGAAEVWGCAGADPAWRGSPQDEALMRRLLDELRPEAIVCANDLTAARLMQTLIGFGVRIPEEVRIVGMDDVKYASLLPVPLTTIHQDCAGIGMVAMATMLERLEHPELPVRDVTVPTSLVVRRSCGSAFVCRAREVDEGTVRRRPNQGHEGRVQ